MDSPLFLNMKNKGIILLIVVAVGIVLAYLLPGKEGGKESPKMKSARKAVVVGTQAPDFALTDMGGKVWRLSELKGKVVLVTFWATWCDTCKEENPSLQKLITAEKDNANFVALTILFDDSMQNAASYMKANNLNFNVLLDDKKASVDYGITGVPETYVVSKKGILSNKIIGPLNWDAPDVRTAIHKLTEES